MSSQIKRLLAHMEAGAEITPLQALSDLGIYRLAARIHVLRERGYKIRTDTLSVKNRYGDVCHIASYKLVASPPAQ